MTTADRQPPRIVEVAFYCWLIAAVLLVAGGLMAAFTGQSALPDKFPGASLSADQIRSFAFVYRGAGLLWVASGLGSAYLAFRARRREDRFRRMAIWLSYAIVLMVVLLGFMFGILVPLTLFALIALVAGAVLAGRKSAVAWFDASGSRRDAA
jgi:hypothetical protein